MKQRKQILKLFHIFFILLFLISFSGSFTETQAQGESNPGVIEVSNPQNYDHIYAISDVHGMFASLVKVLKASQLIDEDMNWIGKKDLLIVVGDSINKGSNTLEVLNLWIRLQSQLAARGGALIHVLGNHEAEFMSRSKHKNKFDALYEELQRKNISVEDFIDGNQPYGRFLRSMPLAARVGTWIFCHSGFYPDLKWGEFKEKAISLLSVGNYNHPFLIGDESILEMKDWEKSKSTRNELLSRLNRIHARGVIFGHQPRAMKIQANIGISRDERLIKIDSGMAPDAGSNDGKILVALDPKEFLDESKTPTFKAIDSEGQFNPLEKEKKHGDDRQVPALLFALHHKGA